MYLDRKPVLHIVDEENRFSADRFLPRISIASIWDATIICWYSVYVKSNFRITKKREEIETKIA